MIYYFIISRSVKTITDTSKSGSLSDFVPRDTFSGSGRALLCQNQEKDGFPKAARSNKTMNAGQPRVLICDPIHDDGVALLRQHTTVDIQPGLKREQLEAIVGDYDALVVRSATKVPASVIEHGHKLRAVGRAGSGLDGIDIAAARARGIEVLNCPDANSLAVAEHA